MNKRISLAGQGLNQVMSGAMAALTLAAFATASLAAPSARAAAPTPVKSGAPTPVSGSSSSAEPWKGESDGSEVHFGALAGLGIIDFSAGFVLLGTASKKVIHRGFVPDINDSVSLEAQAGPIFTQGTAAFQYSLHLRWDFQKDEHWTLYALGGGGGYITGTSINGGSFLLHPRFGLGTFFRVNDLILLRGEISHELIAAGLTIPLYL